MDTPRRTVIRGSGSYLPPRRVENAAFAEARFHSPDGQPLAAEPAEVIAKFEQITGITERRYVDGDLKASDIGALAGERALAAAGVDRESLDYLIVAHNFGDVADDNRRSEMVPSLASRIKARLGIANPRTVAYDLAFGCPGWLQGMIQADYFLKSGDADRALVIGTETLSRISDPHDRDSMIYADGAGAVVLEARATAESVGILAHATRTDAVDHAYLLWMDTTAHPTNGDGGLYLKMNGHKVYEYAVRTVPEVASDCLAKAGLTIDQLAKILLHQANAKMDEAIAKRALRAGNGHRSVAELVPMTVDWLGNSSVATLPTLWDLLVRGELPDHRVTAGDVVLFASVGAGMNINALAYRLHAEPASR